MSKAVHSPIHIGTINRHQVRFFKGLSGKPDMPWHAFDDLAKAVGFQEEMRRAFLQATQSDWKGQMQSIATSDGIVVIAPHYVAQGTVGAAIETRRCSPDVEVQYAAEGAKALSIIMAHVPPEGFLDFLGQAFRSSNGVEVGNV